MHLIIEVLCSGDIIKVTAYEEEDRKDWGDGQYAPQQCDIE